MRCAWPSASLYWTNQPLTRDEREYLSLARSLTAGRGFVYDSEVLRGPVEPFGRAPGYPVFLALVGGGRDVVGAVPTSVKVAQSVVGAIGVLLVAALAGRLAGPRAAVAGAAIAAVYPPLVWVSAYAYSEAVFWPFGLLVVWSIDRLTPNHARLPALAFASGALAAPAYCCERRSDVLTARRSVGCASGVGLRPAVLFALGARPRDHAVGGPQLRSSRPLRHRRVGRRCDVLDRQQSARHWRRRHGRQPRLKEANAALRARHPDLNEEQMEPVYYREALSWIRTNPGAWLALEVKKLFYLIVPIGPSYTLHSTRYLIASVVSYGTLLVLALAGFLRLGTAPCIAHLVCGCSSRPPSPSRSCFSRKNGSAFR